MLNAIFEIKASRKGIFVRVNSTGNFEPISFTDLQAKFLDRDQNFYLVIKKSAFTSENWLSLFSIEVAKNENGSTLYQAFTLVGLPKQHAEVYWVYWGEDTVPDEIPPCEGAAFECYCAFNRGSSFRIGDDEEFRSWRRSYEPLIPIPQGHALFSTSGEFGYEVDKFTVFAAPKEYTSKYNALVDVASVSLVQNGGYRQLVRQGQLFFRWFGGTEELYD